MGNRPQCGKKMESEFTSNLWACFDKIYCISIDDRKDRRVSARLQFRKVGLGDRVEFLIVGKHAVDREQGIYESHISCMKKGLQASARMMLIFEDDVVFDRYNRHTLSNCIDFLATNQEWKIFFFGCLVSNSQPTENDSVLKVKYRSLAHAYIIRRRIAETMIDQPWRHVPYDVLLRSLADKSYAAYPAFAFQSDASTDNIHSLNLDRFRRYCGGLKRIQKMNEWYYRHRSMVIAIHAIVFLVILLLVVWHPGSSLP